MLMNYGLENFEYHTLSEAAYDESQLKPIQVLNGQADRLDALAYTDIKIIRGESTSLDGNRPDDTGLSQDALPSSEEQGLLLKKGEKIETRCQITSQLTAPVSAGTQVGTVKYLVGGEVYKIEYIVTATDVPAIDFSWCMKQILKRYNLYG